MNSNEIETTGFSRRHFIQGVSSAAIAAGVMSTSSLSALAAPFAAKQGGTLKIGVVGGANDLFDANYIVAKADQARLMSTFETLLTFNEKFQPVTANGLAESAKAISPTKYIVKLRKGVKFHDGSLLTADDVIATFKRLLDPSKLTTGKPLRTFLDPSGLVKIDNLTVEFNLKLPNVDWLSVLCGYTYAIAKAGYDGKTQIGTSGYKLVSFTPGRESVHTRFKDYWDAKNVYLDEVRIIDFADKTALVNALIAKQIDVAVDIPFEQFKTLKSKKYLNVVENSAGAWLAFCMRLDIKPFDDNNVRQALRMIVDRKQMLNRVLSGHGKIGNDLYGYIDENYNANNYPVKKQDIAGAVALLKKSGYTKANPLRVELTAPDDTSGLVLMIQTLAEQAKKTDGVVIIDAKVIDGGTYWSAKGQYMNTGFYTTYWSGRSYLAQAAASMDVYPETKFPPAGSTFRKDYELASGTVNAKKRREIVARMQKEEYEKGAYIIPFFNNFADAYSTKVQGVVVRPAQLNMDYYQHGFKYISLA